MSDLPIACKLSPGELAERKVVLAQLTEGIVERKNVDGGVALRFNPEPGVVQRLARLVDLERECCPFIRFNLRIEPAEGPIWLELTGPKPAAGIVRELFPAEPKRE